MGLLGSTWKSAGAHGSRSRFWSGVAACSLVISTLVLLPASPAQAATTKSLQLSLSSARTEPRAFGGTGVSAGDPIPNFKFILNIDDTGTTDQRSPRPGRAAPRPTADYPQSCLWPSIKEPSGWSPIYTQGNQDDLPLADLPDGRYLISVMADGYKIDGAHFCVDMNAPSVPGCSSPLSGTLDIQLQPNPLPDGTLRAQVFADTAATNMGFDTGEPGLPGFSGHIFDTLGEVQTDVYGNPLCTRYEGENPDTYEIPLASLDADMLPIPIPGTGGKCLSDSTGMLAIPHLGPNRYTVTVTPPDNGQTWIQTTTLEGNHDYDMWLMQGDTGYSTILAHGGEPTPDPIFGFVQATDTMSAGLGPHQGRRRRHQDVHPAQGRRPSTSGAATPARRSAAPIERPWLSLQDLEAGDTAVWIGQGDANGAFDISRRPGRQLHAELVGRAAGLQPQHDQRDHQQRRDGRDGAAAAQRLVDRVRRLRLQRHQPQRRQGPG